MKNTSQNTNSSKTDIKSGLSLGLLIFFIILALNMQDDTLLSTLSFSGLIVSGLFFIKTIQYEPSKPQE